MEKSYEEPGYVSEHSERITANSTAHGIAYKAARFTARTVFYSTIFAVATYLSFSAARVPIEMRVGNTQVDNRKAIECIDSIFRNNSQLETKSNKPSKVELGPNY